MSSANLSIGSHAVAKARHEQSFTDISRRLDRRSFIKNAFVSSTLLFATGCEILESVSPEHDDGPNTLSTVGISLDRVVQQAAIQECPLWCWAAAASMVFGFLGRPVSQTSIVTRSFGGLVCAAASPAQVVQSLSGPYVDAAGRAFSTQIVASYDYHSGFNTLSNAGLVQLLSAGRPLLYCNQNHAMVLYELSYLGGNSNPNVQQAKVIDPWPAAPRLRSLSSAEMLAAHLGGQMTFLAAVQAS